MTKYALTFPTISDDPGDIYARFSIPVQPAIVVVSPDGKAQKLLGAVDDSTLDTILRDATNT